MTTFERVGSESSTNSRRSDDGRGFSEQEVGFDFKIVVFSSASVIGEMNENWSQPVGQ